MCCLRTVCDKFEKRCFVRILVVSDTHGDLYTLREVITKQRTAEVVIHLGDGADEFELLRPDYPEKMFLGVRGNCDFGSDLPHTETMTIEGKKIYYTHGYVQRVKLGRYDLLREARSAKADICLFGHTHRAMTDYDDGLYILNPGTLSRSRGGGKPSYGIVDITSGGIFTKIMQPI